MALIILAFTWSYAKARAFRTYLQEWSFCIAILTSANILAEAVILRAVYSPFVVIILLLFLLSASVIVRLRFVYTSVLCWGSLLVYDLICIVHFRNGDDFVGGTADDGGANEVARWAFWYNFVIVSMAGSDLHAPQREEVGTRTRADSVCSPLFSPPSLSASLSLCSLPAGVHDRGRSKDRTSCRDPISLRVPVHDAVD